MKQCSKCLLMLPLSRFAWINARGGKRARHASWCHDCTNTHRHAPTNQTNPAPLAQVLKEWKP